MAEANKVRFGLCNVHIFPIVKDNAEGTEYGEPFRLPGAVDLTIGAEGDETTFYADNMAYYNEFVNGGYSGDLEIALVPEKFETEILGLKKDKNGALIENIGAKPKSFALAFEFDGDKHPTRHVLYNVSTSRPEISGHTNEKGKTIKTDKIKITAAARNDGNLKAKVNAGGVGYDTFFTKVYEPVAE